MKNFKKTLVSLGFIAAFLSSAASAQDAPKAPEVPNPAPSFANKPQVILFKIHNIKPVVDPEGVTTACEYTATFFNRTPLSLRQAKINFGWTDTVSDLFSLDEPAEATTEEGENKPAPVSKDKPKKEGLGSILSSVDLPALGSLRQISVQGRAETDKCFALFDNLKFDVAVCNILGQEGASSSSRRNDAKASSNCASLFAYVNSKHPEYYGEFKEISYEEQVEQEKTAEEKEMDAIKSVNEKISSTLKQIATTLNDIK